MGKDAVEKAEMFDMQWLRRLIRVNVMGITRNRDVRERRRNRILKLFGHMEWMSDGRIGKKL